MGWNFLGTDWHLFGKLADVALLTLLFAATVMFFYIQRLRKQPQLPIAENVRAKQTVLTKVRKRQPNLGIVFATGDGPSAGLAAEAGDVVLTKPYGAAQLIAALGKALAARKVAEAVVTAE